MTTRLPECYLRMGQDTKMTLDEYYNLDTNPYNYFLMEEAAAASSFDIFSPLDPLR
jgi:hypothetical protein